MKSSRPTTPPVKRSSAGDWRWLEIYPNFPIQEICIFKMVDFPASYVSLPEIYLFFFLLVFEGKSLANIQSGLVSLRDQHVTHSVPRGHRIEDGKKTGEDISWTRN